MTERTRRCCLCREERPLKSSWFERSGSPRKGGFNYECKMCASLRNRIGYRRRRLAQAEARIEPLDDAIRRHCENALHLTNGDVIRTAELLGIGKASLYRYLQQWGTTSKSYVNPDHVELASLLAEWKQLHRDRPAKDKARRDESARQLVKIAADYLAEDQTPTSAAMVRARGNAGAVRLHGGRISRR